ncbi:MAG: methyltransferase domain-containing protein [Dehalococcoidia bacterium]|nr:methyltransferase domain-containing protein [Dehalococcoidia bacterium]
MNQDNYYFDPRVAAAYDASPELPVDDVPFYVDLALEAHAAGQSVLELGCGTGRVTIPIAEAGAEVVGLDGSPAMLEIARRKAPNSDNPRWVQADMRDFDLGRQFGLAIIPFRSFLHLLTPEDQLSCLGHVHTHLLADGRLALNFFVPDPRLLELAHQDIDRRSFISRVERRMRLRHVTQDEMQHLLDLAGFDVEALHGWFDRRPFDDTSTEMVWLARKRP